MYGSALPLQDGLRAAGLTSQAANSRRTTVPDQLPISILMQISAWRPRASQRRVAKQERRSRCDADT